MTDSDTPVITTQPVDPLDTLLQEKFVEDLTKQSDRLDDFAKQLFTLALAIPALYATVLKLVEGRQATLSSDHWWIPFLFWGLALAATLASLFPLRYQVNRQVIRNQPQAGDKVLSIEGFYELNARFKRYALFLATAWFFVGVISAAWLLA